MRFKRKTLFCDINPTCYAISLQKEICKRHIKDFLSAHKFAYTKSEASLPNVVYSHSSNMIKRAPGINLQHQKNKAVNIELAAAQISGIVVKPGEVFSFWKLVGKISKKKGYLAGRVLYRKNLTAGIGGGLCNLANTINLLVLHSPLQITELHKHSDALAPDEGARVPFGTGTSIEYNSIDYRFENNTNQAVQLVIWCAGETLHAELRSEKEFLEHYRLIEENHHFKKEKEKYYRISTIFKETYDDVGNLIKKEVIWDNKSEVMYDYSLIPPNLINN